MKTKLVFALFLLLPTVAFSQGADISRFHIENSVSQEFPVPACLGLPDGATISEDSLQIVDITPIENNGGFHEIDVVESNGTATANDGAWLRQIYANLPRRRTKVTALHR